jgi:hypothetical protein
MGLRELTGGDGAAAQTGERADLIPGNARQARSS